MVCAMRLDSDSLGIGSVPRIASLKPTAYLRCVAATHSSFWHRHQGLVWSNPEAEDSVHIRTALLRPRFGRLLDIAAEFGLDRLQAEWSTVKADNSPEVQRATPAVERILSNIQKGFSVAAAEN